MDMNVKFGSQSTGLMELIKDADDTTHVGEDDFQTSSRRLYSDGFGSCIAVVLLDYDRAKGAIAHLSVNTDPNQCFHGYVRSIPGKGPSPVEKLSEVYLDPSKVRALHIDDPNDQTWTADQTQSTLKAMGFEDFLHYQLPRGDGGVYSKAIALDVQRALVHIESAKNNGLITVPLFNDIEF